MPEGDVVWRTAQRLDAALAGRLLQRCDLRWPSLAEVDLAGRGVRQVVSAGKHLLLRVDGTHSSPPLTLHSHLRMEGSWSLRATNPTDRAGAPGKGRSAEGIRAVLVTDAWTAVGHRLGMLDLVATADEASLVGHLGPDLLGPGWDERAALANLLTDDAREIGEALLDQRVLAGVGTFFMSEALFVRGITPWTPVAAIDDLVALVTLVRRMLLLARGEVSQTTTGDTRPAARQWVHSRSGRPCRRCGDTVRVAIIGRAPQERTAFYCPTCQRGPAPTDDGRRQVPLGTVSRSGPRRPRRTPAR